jgi:hypothetical protein
MRNKPDDQSRAVIQNLVACFRRRRRACNRQVVLSWLAGAMAAVRPCTPEKKLANKLWEAVVSDKVKVGKEFRR